MDGIAIFACVVSFIITALVIIKLCQIANNTAEIRDILLKLQGHQMPEQEPEKPVTKENEDENSVFQMLHY